MGTIQTDELKDKPKGKVWPIPIVHRREKNHAPRKKVIILSVQFTIHHTSLIIAFPSHQYFERYKEFVVTTFFCDTSLQWSVRESSWISLKGLPHL